MNIKTRHAIAHLNAAACYAANSHAQRLRVGALLVKGETGDIPVAQGWNGRLPGEPNVCEECDGHGGLKTRSDVRHAEINALNKLRKSSESSEGSVMFCTHAACYPCATDMVLSGVVGFVYENDYRDRDGIKYLLDHGVKVYRYDRRLERFFRLEQSKLMPKCTETNIHDCLEHETKLEFNQ
jgi:dCMP deaminase